MEHHVVHIALDVEAAGGQLSRHSTLSIGACVVTREPLSFEDYFSQGLVFYTELQPSSLVADLDAMRVGCSQLVCLEEKRLVDPRFDVAHQEFDPVAVLEYMQKVCENPVAAMERFSRWVADACKGKKCIGVTDTVFFDGGHINYCFGQTNTISPFGWAGLDLDSVYRGYCKRADASLKEFDVVDHRLKPHRADHDAVFLAERARRLLYEKMG